MSAFSLFLAVSAVVRIAADAPNDVCFAAHDLSRLLERMTETAYPVVSDETVADAAFEIGTPQAAAVCGPVSDVDGFSLSAEGGRVSIIGGSPIGTAQGVYSLLEKELGCRFLTPWGDDFVPSVRTLRIPDVRRTGRPALNVRSIFGYDNRACGHSNGTLCCYRHGHNFLAVDNFRNVVLPAGCTNLVPRYKTAPTKLGWFFSFVPPESKDGQPGYFAEHPEYFSYSKAEGKRVARRQLCFSNPDVRRIIIGKLLKEAQGRPDDNWVYNLTAQDVKGAFCECPDCEALVRKYGAVGAPFFDFLRDLGAALKRVRPHALVQFLAYRRDQAQTPPNAAFGRFPDNLVVVFAPIEGDFSKDFSHPNNAADYADLKAWCRVSRHVWLWYYPLTYTTIYPMAGMDRLAADTRLAAEAGIDGGWYEHNVGLCRGANFTDLQAYLISKLYQDPKADHRAIIRDFCRHYYGAAADDMLAYIADLEAEARKCPYPVLWHHPLRSAFTADNLLRWNAAFDRMERTVGGDAALVQRVREARMGLDMVTLEYWHRVKDVLDKTGVTPEKVCARGLATLDAATERRYPDPNLAGAAWNRRSDGGIRLQFEQERQLAESAGAKPPAEFAHLPAEAVLQAMYVRMNPKIRAVDMPDAVLGKGYTDPTDKVEKGVGFKVGIQDESALKGIASRTIPESEIKYGRFALYPVGRVRLTRDCYVWTGRMTRVTCPGNSLYLPGSDDEYDLYVSLKFETEDAGGLVYFDRAVFVRRDLVR